jgi:hypothetical protein
VNEPDSKNPDRTPKQPSGDPGSQLDEARDLINTMVGEARRLHQLESDAALARKPLAKVLLALTIMAAVVAAAVLVYGIYMFPDAPIRATESGYQGKGGTLRTIEHFEAFELWKTAMLTTVPAVFVLGFAFAIADASRRRRKA